MARIYRQYPWEELNVGDSFTVKNIAEGTIRVSASFASKRLRRRFSVYRLGNNKFKVKREPGKAHPQRREYPWLTLKIGESFFFPRGTIKASQKAWKAGKRVKRKFSVEFLEDQLRYKVTRVRRQP